MPQDYELRLKQNGCVHRETEEKKWCKYEYWDDVKKEWRNYNIIHMQICKRCGAARFDENWSVPVD